jgi:hypothetical protein
MSSRKECAIPGTCGAPKNTAKLLILKGKSSGGGGGIRTHGTREGTTVFETVPIDHSGTPPQGSPRPRSWGRRRESGPSRARVAIRTRRIGLRTSRGRSRARTLPNLVWRCKRRAASAGFIPSPLSRARSSQAVHPSPVTPRFAATGRAGCGLGAAARSGLMMALYIESRAVPAPKGAAGRRSARQMAEIRQIFGPAWGDRRAKSVDSRGTVYIFRPLFGNSQ